MKNILFVSKFLHIGSQWLIGVLLAAVLVLTFDICKEYYLNSLPISNTIITQLIVPDYPEGQNPLIVYNRTINESFIGDFSVEVKSVTSHYTVCFGGANGVKYDVGEKIDTTKYTLSYYVYGRDDCAKRLPVGQYYIQTTWTVHRDGLEARHFTTVSNIFNVLPEKPLTPQS